MRAAEAMAEGYEGKKPKAKGIAWSGIDANNVGSACCAILTDKARTATGPVVYTKSDVASCSID